MFENFKLKLFCVSFLFSSIEVNSKEVIEGCRSSITTAIVFSDDSKPLSNFCSGDLIFDDNFDVLDTNVWKIENSMGIGGGSKEFQWYTNDKENVFVKNGILHLKPTLTADKFGEKFLYTGSVEIPADECTFSLYNGCNKTADFNNIINPIRSVRMNTYNSFCFKYGRVEIKAKTPNGDWLFPALWMNPRYSVYGPWPMSGEIDIMESRGNPFLTSGITNVGVEQIASTLHFGPKANVDAWRTAHGKKNQKVGYDKNFHIYELVWTPKELKFLVDHEHIVTIDADEGFFERGNFSEDVYLNPWINGTLLAPFDQYFYGIINLAVGGTSFFSDSFVNKPHEKPWLNNSTRPMAEFWEARDHWLPGWRMNQSDDSHFQIDYFRIFAL